MADNGDGEDSFVRLHITPLDPELIKAVIPDSVLPTARNVSYHTIQTFPEKRYGFVELPREEAEKLKKKFHGVTFKGSKMRIEKARPEERIEPTNMVDSEETEKKKSRRRKEKNEEKEGDQPASDKSKKRKREVDVLEGVSLKDRKVKRGWTETPNEQKKKKRSKKDGDKDKKEEKKSSKKRPQSKYTEGEECLLKLKMPPNALKNVPAADLSSQKKKKKKGNARQVLTVHEFERTTKFPSFLRQSVGGAENKRAAEFVEGKGWLDEEGNVVEAVKEKPERSSVKTKSVKPTSRQQEDEDSSETSSDGTSSSSSSSEGEEEEDSDEEMEAAPSPPNSQKVSKNKYESDSDSATSSSSEDESSDGPALTPKKNESTPDPAEKAALKRLVIQTVNPETPQASRIHPLEALYKRPKPDSDDAARTPAATKETEPFSFFGGGADLEGEDEEAPGQNGEEDDSVPAMPMTPFTRQDMEWRTVRSAAPTPDTTHPSRMQRLWPVGTPSGNGRIQRWDEAEEEPEEEQEEEEEEEGQEEGREQTSSSDFQKWFWENRRDLNRSWMSRRKTAAKERRYRDNKARASKAV